MAGDKKVCCFFGHRKIVEAEVLRKRLFAVVEGLVLNNKAEIFLFGSKSEFDKMCRDVVAELKEKYPHIYRVYIRAEYQYIDESYEKILLQDCEETYYSQRAVNAGKAVYVERNFDMIDKADICVVYYREESIYHRKKGTAKED